MFNSIAKYVWLEIKMGKRHFKQILPVFKAAGNGIYHDKSPYEFASPFNVDNKESAIYAHISLVTVESLLSLPKYLHLLLQTATKCVFLDPDNSNSKHLMRCVAIKPIAVYMCYNKHVLHKFIILSQKLI